MTKPIELTALALLEPMSRDRYGWTLAVCRNGRRCGKYYSDSAFKSEGRARCDASDMAEAMNIRIERWADG